MNYFDLTQFDAESLEAYRLLCNAEAFGIGGVGFSSIPTVEQYALFTLFAKPQAVSIFRQLLCEDKVEGGMYALFGLYLVDKSVFAEEATIVTEYFGADREVTVEGGCRISTVTLETVIKWITKGQYDGGWFRSCDIFNQYGKPPYN